MSYYDGYPKLAPTTNVKNTTNIPDEMSIYDVLEELVEMQQWPSEAAKLRRTRAIQVARDSNLLGSKGTFKL